MKRNFFSETQCVCVVYESRKSLELAQGHLGLDRREKGDNAGNFKMQFQFGPCLTDSDWRISYKMLCLKVFFFTFTGRARAVENQSRKAGAGTKRV